MIKKFFHYICVIIACALLSVVLAFIYQLILMLLFKVDPLSLQTYHSFSGYWNSGGVLKGKDILMMLLILSYFPLCFFGFYKLWHYKYMRLVTVPLNKIVNRGLDGYVAPNINIKNLKVEEKKTLDQIVQERLDAEKKKNAQNSTDRNFRHLVIEQIIEETKK